MICRAGDCAIASCFVSYLGPFIKEMREQLLSQAFIGACQKLGISYSKDLQLTQFLTSDAEVGEWTTQVRHRPYDEIPKACACSPISLYFSCSARSCHAAGLLRVRYPKKFVHHRVSRSCTGAAHGQGGWYLDSAGQPDTLSLFIPRARGAPGSELQPAL